MHICVNAKWEMTPDSVETATLFSSGINQVGVRCTVVTRRPIGSDGRKSVLLQINFGGLNLLEN